MLRSIMLATAVATLLLLVSSCASGPGTSDPSPSGAAQNIGFVLYTESGTPGTLNARWNYANRYSGAGVAAGGPTTGGFAGRYHVRYFLESGEFSDEYDLVIERHEGGDFYDVTWLIDARISARGVGMEVANGRSLAVAWHRTTD
jgi:hypothetical protein